MIGPGSDIKLENNHLCCYNIDRKTFGVFPRISRINHSCVPNCVDSAGSNKEEKIVVALRKILKGEELSLSYLHTPAGSKAMRAEELRYWNFVCHCELCLRETRAESVSRENIVALVGEVTDFVKLLEDAQDQEPYMNDDQKRFLSTTIYCGIDKKLAACETLVQSPQPIQNFCVYSEFLSFFFLYSRLLANFLSHLGKWLKSNQI